MKKSIRLKSVLASLLHYFGILRWRLNRYSKNEFVILMYHRIIPWKSAGANTQAGMYVEPETFDLHIKILKKYLEIVPLAAIVFSGGINKLGLGKRCACVLTFDDGWRDFHQCAFPVLRSHQVPATVFLPTDFIGTDQWFWTDRLGFLLLHSESRSKRPEPSSNPLLNRLQSLKGPFEIRLERSINLLKKLRNEEIEEVLATMAAAQGIEPKPGGRAFLDWKEVEELANSGLVTFGSHTAGHRILTTLTE